MMQHVLDASAVGVHDILKVLPDKSIADSQLRHLLNISIPCPVPHSTWSLVNILDTDFSGFSSKHLSAYVPTLIPSLVVMRDVGLVAKLAYEDFNVISYICNIWGMKSPAENHYQSGDTQAFIMYDDDNIVLSFRGTELLNTKDWATDFNVQMTELRPRILPGAARMTVPSGKPMVHVGFLQALGLHSPPGVKSCFSQVHDAVCKLFLQKTRKLWITGHSLGAALASVFVSQLLVESDYLITHLAGLYTYGQPRCGDLAYCQLFRDLEIAGKVFRIVNHNDIVPRVPTKVMKFTHHGIMVFISGKGDIAVDKPLSPDTTPDIDLSHPVIVGHGTPNKKFEVEALQTAWSLLCPYYAADHYPCEYIRHLEKKMPATP